MVSGQVGSAGSSPTGEVGVSGGSQSISGATRATTRRSGKVQPQYGIRPLKMYHVTEIELSELATLGGLSTLFIALGTFLAGMSWDLWFALSDTSSTDAMEFWRGVQIPTAIGSLFCFILAVALVIRHAIRSRAIKADTQF